MLIVHSYEELLIDIGYDIADTPSDTLASPTGIPLQKRKRLNGESLL